MIVLYIILGLLALAVTLFVAVGLAMISRAACIIALAAALLLIGAAVFFLIKTDINSDLTSASPFVIVLGGFLAVILTVWFFIFYGFSDLVIRDGVLEKYRGKGDVIELPLEVTVISDGAFSYYVGYTYPSEVVIGPRVTEIEPGAFRGIGDARITVHPAHPVFYIDNGNLMTREGGVLLHASPDGKAPGNASSVADYAYSDVAADAAVELSAGVLNISELAFSGCEAKAITISDTEIPDRLSFLSTVRLRNLTLRGVSGIGHQSFYGVRADNIVIESSSFDEGVAPFIDVKTKRLKIIDSDLQPELLWGLTVSELTLPYVNAVGVAYFKDLFNRSEVPESLHTLRIEGGEIPAYCFESCMSLKTVIITDGVRGEIGEHAFYGCNRIKRFYLGTGVTGFGKGSMSLNKTAIYNLTILYSGNDYDWAHNIGMPPNDKTYRANTVVTVKYNVKTPE